MKKAALVLLLLVAGCHKRPVEVPATTNLLASAALSTNTIHVGDVVTLKLKVSHPADGRLELPDLNRGREIVVRDQQSAGDGVAYRITSLETSNHVVSTNVIRFVRSDGSFLQQPFPFLTLDVQSLLTGTNAQLRDIKGLAAWPNRTRDRILLVLGLVAALALLAGLVALWLGQRRRPAAPPPPPPPPYEVALRALQALLQKNYIETENIEPFYVELSDIVRTYIESRFQLRAPELTTEEFIREAVSSRLLSLDHQQLTMAFLEQCDLVKFARHRPQQADMRAAFAAAERLVKETIPQPAEGRRT